jgi:polysaccharide export outer membrane protein
MSYPKAFSRAPEPILMLLALALAACGHTGNFTWVDDAPSSAPVSEGDYVIGAGDLLNVRVFNQEGMSAKVRVRNDGQVSLPFLNDFKAAGYTPTDLAQQLQTRLKDFIVNPVVTVSLEEARPLTVSVLGEVQKPGTYPVEVHASVLSALASAGGVTDFADRDRIFVLRPIATGTLRIRFTYRALCSAQGKAASFRLTTGDVVVVE